QSGVFHLRCVRQAGIRLIIGPRRHCRRRAAANAPFILSWHLQALGCVRAALPGALIVCALPRTRKWVYVTTYRDWLIGDWEQRDSEGCGGEVRDWLIGD